MDNTEKVVVVCPGCKAKIRANKKSEDRVVNCPKCQTELIIKGCEIFDLEDHNQQIFTKNNFKSDQTTPRSKNVSTDKPFSINQDKERNSSKPNITSTSHLGAKQRFVPESSEKQINTKYCHHCGEMISLLAEICPKCGVRQSRILGSNSDDSDSRKIVAALLAFFLGCFGAHWFYLGDSKKGLIYLLVSIVGLVLILPPLIIGLISMVDAITFLSMKNSVFSQKYPIE